MMRIEIRRIRKKEDALMAAVVRRVMPEFGANTPGFALFDPEVDALSEAYSKDRSAYFICVYNGKVMGGAGIAQLQGGDEDTCELKKMYFLPEARGRGMGRQVLQVCIREAKEFGYKNCYIETFHTMHDAMKLYEKNGFEEIPGPLGNTGHFACDKFYLLKL